MVRDLLVLFAEQLRNRMGENVEIGFPFDFLPGFSRQSFVLAIGQKIAVVRVFEINREGNTVNHAHEVFGQNLLGLDFFQIIF